MKKLLMLFFLLPGLVSLAQPTREQLEKQNQQYKKEMQELERLAKENKQQTSQTYAAVKLKANKIAIQEKVINNISRDINLLEDNIYTLQKDINRYDRILDTLKQEYAKSMVYAYKNRNNYQFLNFMFSASSFNDALKRVAYLKSYREYREMQGENILRTQEMRRERIEQITGVKQTKKSVLDNKEKEVTDLEKEKQEQDKRLAELRKNGKQIAAQFAEKKRQIRKVQDLVAKILKEEKRKALEAEKARIAAEKKRLADEAARDVSKTPTNKTSDPVVKKKNLAKTPKTAPVKSELPQEMELASENFARNRGSLPWPVGNGAVIIHYGKNDLGAGNVFVFDGISIASDIGTPVKCVFNGVISSVQSIDGDAMVVLVRHGEYMTTYSNISGVTVKVGQQVTAGQVLGKVLPNLEGVGAVDFLISDDKGEKNPEQWLRNR